MNARNALVTTLLAAALAVPTLGCGSEEEPAAGGMPDSETQPAAEKPPPAAPTSAAAAEARQIFETRCAVCHGVQGAGDGPGSAGLDPKPRDFRDPEWQDSVTDEHIAKIIKFGGAAVGKSPTMPGNPDLMAKPEVVAGLVAHVRSLRSE